MVYLHVAASKENLNQNNISQQHQSSSTITQNAYKFACIQIYMHTLTDV